MKKKEFITGAAGTLALTVTRAAVMLLVMMLTATTATAAVINVASTADLGTKTAGSDATYSDYYLLADGNTYRLTADVNLDGYLRVENATVTIDLNGHKLNRGLTESTKTYNGCVITARTSTLTICDSGSGGTITGGYSKDGAGGLYVNMNSTVTMTSGTISGNYADKTAGGVYIHYTSTFNMTGGSVTVSGTAGDGLDGDTGFIEINGGTLHVTASTTDTKAVKCDSILTINGGEITLIASGAQSKALKSDQTITINGGTITITASGATVLETVNNQTDPSYCSAIATDGEVRINGGTISITLPTSNNGGKGISADRDIHITGGTVNITTAGAGAAYTVSGSTKDSYSSSCIKTNANLYLTGGHITCSSSGSGGKGIRADSALVIGELEAADSLLTLNVTTTGERFTVSNSGSWPGPGGDNGEYCNPKAIRGDGNLTINSGMITVTCTQNNEGGEGIESKNILNINGGQLNISSTGDDAINAANRLNINGGTTYATSTNNDAIDCNGPMYITGGFTIASASKSPEEAFDCDNYTFGITGGTIMGTASNGMFSNPTTSACSQHSLKYTHAGNNNIQLIRNSDNAEIVTFHIPNNSAGGYPGPGGSSSVIFFFSSPELVQGTYTLKYGGNISGGTNFHNYYTGATYSGGSTKTVTVGASFNITSVN